MMTSTSKKDVPRRELRQFGIGLGLLFGLIGGLMLWKENAAGAVLVLGGLILALAFWWDVPGVRAFYAGWMKLAGALSRIMTTVLLTLLYVLVLTPIALLARLFGQRFVARGFREECDSYWESHSGSKDRRSSEKQS